MLPSRYSGSWLAHSTWSGNPRTAKYFIPVKLPPAPPFQQPRSPHCRDRFWPCSADAPAHLPSVAGVCVCTQPFMLLLLPQDLVPLKQGLWFDRLPVLGLQSTRPVGVAVLLSTCSWLLCVVPSSRLCSLASLHPVLFMLLGFSIVLRGSRGTRLNGRKTMTTSWVGFVFYKFCFWQGQQA